MICVTKRPVRLFERGLTTMEVQKITGHKTLAMLLRYTQMYGNHVVERLDATDEAGKRAMTEVQSREPAKAATARSNAQSDSRTNVIPFRRRQAI